MARADDIDTRLDRFQQRVVGRSITEGTFTDYEKWIRRFEGWMEHRGVTDPGLADLEDWDNYLADEDRTDYVWDNGQGTPAPASYAYRSRTNAVSAVKMWLVREYDRRIPETPGDICLGEPEPFEPTYLDPDAVTDIITNADDDCDRPGCEAALRLSYDCILRASELTRVETGDVDLDAGTVYVRAAKGSQNAEIGVDRQTARALRDHLDAHPDRDRLFHNSYGRGWRPKAWATHVWRNHTPDGSHVVGRHSPIMHRLEGADPEILDTSFGDEDFGSVFRRARHSQPSMTARYARVVGVDVPEWAGDG